MKIKVLSSYNGEAYNKTVDLLRSRGHKINCTPEYDLTVCPDFDNILSDNELNEPLIGTLVFHPSPLPYMRGKNAIKRQYEAGDKVGGGTWIWADGKVDGGDICEQELTLIDPLVRPRDYYNSKIIPIMLRTLERAISNIEKGSVRRIKQFV